MRVLVTGAAGFIGSHVARQLVEQGDEVVALLRPSSNVGRLTDVSGRLAIVAADLGDQSAVSKVFELHRPEGAIHLAWYANPRDYLDSECNLDSLGATLRFVQAAVAAGCRRLVGAGTCLEYADLPRPRREDDPTHPESLYAATKLSAYLVSRRLAERAGASFAWARIFHPYGPGEDAARVLPTVVAALQTNRPIDLSACSQLRDPVRVEDVATALVSLVRGTTRGIFNLSAGQPLTLRELLESVAARLGRPDLLRFGRLSSRPGEPACLVGEPTRLMALGWKPVFASIEDGLAYLDAAPS